MRQRRRRIYLLLVSFFAWDGDTARLVLLVKKISFSLISSAHESDRPSQGWPSVAWQSEGSTTSASSPAVLTAEKSEPPPGAFGAVQADFGRLEQRRFAVQVQSHGRQANAHTAWLPSVPDRNMALRRASGRLRCVGAMCLDAPSWMKMPDPAAVAHPSNTSVAGALA